MVWTGLLAAAVALVAATAFGLVRKSRDGRFRAERSSAFGRSSASGLPSFAGFTGFSAEASDAGLSGTGLSGTGLSGTGPSLAEPSAGGPSGAQPSAGELSGAELSAGGPSGAGPVDLAALGVRPGQTTLLQFSSAFCAPCRATRVLCAQVALAEPDVDHVEVDAESHLEAVRALNIWRTPTVLIVDPAGRILGRAQGTPTLAQLRAAIGALHA